MWAVAGMLHASPSPTRPLSSTLVGVGVLAAAGLPVWPDRGGGRSVACSIGGCGGSSPAWTLRSAAAAAAVCAAWGVVVPALNRIHFPGPGLAIAQFVACAVGEGLAMFAVQRPADRGWPRAVRLARYDAGARRDGLQQRAAVELQLGGADARDREQRLVRSRAPLGDLQQRRVAEHDIGGDPSRRREPPCAAP